MKLFLGPFLYLIYKLIFFYKIKILKKIPVFILQPGKVGSETVTYSLSENQNQYYLIHNHHLSRSNCYKTETHFETGWRAYVPTYERGHMLGAKIKKMTNKNEIIKVISGSREPIARNLSAYFQNIRVYYPNLLEDWNQKRIDAKGVFNHFQKYFRHDVILEWFDTEFKSIFDIDLYSIDLDIAKKGHVNFKAKNTEVFLYRLESINEEGFADDLYVFLDLNHLKGMQLQTYNLASDKPIALIYDQVKKIAKFERDYLEKMYNSKYSKYFYSSKEIEEFRKKWSVL